MNLFSKSLCYSRDIHLSSYLNHPILQPSTRPVSSKDDTTYDTVFQTKYSQALVLRIYMSLGNNKAPIMSLIGIRGNHPFLDSNFRVTGFETIKTDENWRTCGVTLGDMVHKVVKHFQLHPPNNIVITDESLKKYSQN